MITKTLAELNEGESIFGVAFVQDTLLSHGSTVFDVVISDGSDMVTINALSESESKRMRWPHQFRKSEAVS